MADRREELLGWIAETKRLQRRLAMIFGALAALAFGMLVWHATVGVFALICIALVAICSFWVTAAHNSAHRYKLEELDRVERNGGKPLVTGHRRWHR